MPWGASGVSDPGLERGWGGDPCDRGRCVRVDRVGRVRGRFADRDRRVKRCGWELRGDQGSLREEVALRIIAIAFVLLAVYIAVQATVTLAGCGPRIALTRRARVGGEALREVPNVLEG